MASPVDNIIIGLLELVEQSAGSTDAFCEDRIFHDASDFSIPTLVGEIEGPPAPLDFGHVLTKVSLSHTPLPTTEQRENEPRFVTKINPVTVSGLLTRCAISVNDLARSSTPFSGNAVSAGVAGKKIVRGNSEFDLFAAGLDFKADNAALSAKDERLPNKNDCSIHPGSPRELEGPNGDWRLNARLTHVGFVLNLNKLQLR